MKYINKMKVVFPSRSVNESLGRMVASAFTALADPTVDELCDIKTAVSEAVTNAAVHGYADTIGDISITAMMYPDNRIVFKIRDKGCGIEDVEKAMEPLFTTCKTGESAGLGFAVMKELCDEVRVHSKPELGTTVTLIKRLRPKE